MNTVLGLPVPAPLIRAWEHHFAPAVQPFYLSDDLAARLAHLPLWKREELHPVHLPLSVSDTLNLHDVAPEATWALLLDEQGFLALLPHTRTELLEAQLGFRRGGVECDPLTRELSVWWPTAWKALTAAARWVHLKTFLDTDRLPCRRRELTPAHRRELRGRFPELLPLMGTFAAESGPNCFGSVMAACGVPGVSGLWMHSPPFMRWLEGVAVLSDDLEACGAVLVWRDASGQVQHAALALGDGWLFHKEAQAWFSPRQVVRQQGALDRWQHEGWTVSSYRLV